MCIKEGGRRIKLYNALIRAAAAIKKMKSLITKISIKIIFIVLFCLAISIFTPTLAPIISNNIALGQLQNDDTAFAIMEIWNQIQNYVTIGEITIVTIIILTILYDVCKYLIGRKENIHHEENN